MPDCPLPPTSDGPVIDDQIAAFRRFTRFYTRQMGLLQRGLLGSPFSMTEGRVLYEIATRGPVTATVLATELQLDHGYLSRILARFEGDGLLTRERARDDGRQHLLRLTAKGRRRFATLNDASREQVAALLGPLTAPERSRVASAMSSIETLLARGPDQRASALVLRSHGPGDMGWVVSVNGALYAAEYGWDLTYEALAAKIVADFLERFDPVRERCWIAELDGERVGSVFVVRKADDIAQLRLLVVDPKARGMGLGGRLVDECVSFATGAGYKTMTLWTQSILTAARRIYERAGFTRVSQSPHRSFGVDLVGETWERRL